MEASSPPFISISQGGTVRYRYAFRRNARNQFFHIRALPPPCSNDKNLGEGACRDQNFIRPRQNVDATPPFRLTEQNREQGRTINNDRQTGSPASS
jgi:hypothetical protein